MLVRLLFGTIHKYNENSQRFRGFIPGHSERPVAMNPPKVAGSLSVRVMTERDNEDVPALADCLPRAASQADVELDRQWRSDPATVTALCSPLRPRHVNPEGHDAHVRFWRRRVTATCLRRGTVFVRASDVVAEWTSQGAAPQCIDQVLQLMHSQGCLMSRDEFDALPSGAVSDASLSSWLTDWLLWRPSRSAWRYVKHWLSTAPPTQPLVDLSALEILSERVYGQLTASHCDTANVATADTLCARCRSLLRSRDDFDAVLRHLCRTGRAAQRPCAAFVAVKLRTPSTTATAAARACKNGASIVTDADTVRLQLSECERVLNGDIETAEQRSSELKQRALQLIKQDSKQQALWCVRQRRQLQRCIARHCGSLEKVSDMMFSLDHAHNNQQVLSAMQSAAALLSHLSRSTDDSVSECQLDGVQRAQQVMTAVTQSLEEQAAISSLISSPSSLTTTSEAAADDGQSNATSSSDTHELEEELRRLLVQPASHTTAPHQDHAQDITSLLPSLSDLPSLSPTNSPKYASHREKAAANS